MITLNNITAAFYSLRRAKGYVTTIVLTLGITLGALVAMFNLNYQILATPLPYPDQERLYLLKGDGLLNGVIDLPNMYPYPAVIEAYKNSTGYFEQSALVYFTSNIMRSFPDTPRVNVTYITPEYLQLANSAVVLGRTFSSSEGLDSYAPVAVISYSTWQTTFNKSPDILGKNLRFGEVDFRIIGVTAENFIEPELMNAGRMTQVWLPWDYNTVEPRYRFWGYFQNNQYFVGKLKPGIDSVQVAQKITAQLNTFYNENLAGQRSFDGSRLGFELLTYRAAIVGNTSSALLLLVAGALVLVLIAATNITNLMLARAVNQQYTMAIQIALGAQKKHLFSNLLTEILLLMSLVILVGLAVAFGSISLLKSVASDQLPRINELAISWQSLVFTILITLLLALAFTHFISRHMNYCSLNNLLQRSGKGAGIQIPVNIRQLLILLQVALTGILLIVSLQILNQAWRNIIQPLGFTTDDNYQVVLNTGTQLEAPIDERKANLFSIRSALHAHPKIANASLTSDFPMSSSSITPWFSYLSEDVDFKQQKQALAILIDEDYPDILDLVWLSGRHFTADEFQTKAHYIIVNETFARRLQPDGKVLNKKYYWLNSDNRQTPYEIIAVVKNFNLSAAEDEARMFIPSAAVQYPRFLLQLKPGQNITAIELNELMAKVNSQYKVAELRSMNDAHQHIVSGDKVAAWLTLSLAIIAFCLAAIGIYGVLSYSVQLRQFELGIRMAIGARPTSIFIKILTDNLKPVVLGLMASLIAAVGLYLWSQHTRYNLQVNLWSWLLPITLMLALTAATSLMSVWYIIRRPASFALKGN